jgi:hypothetical protein
MIKAPNWCKDAEATTRGWVKNGELLVARKFTQEQVDEYNGVQVVEQMYEYSAPVEEVVEEVPQMLNEAAPNNTSLEDMTKRELVALCREKGISANITNSKKSLIAKLS